MTYTKLKKCPIELTDSAKVQVLFLLVVSFTLYNYITHGGGGGCRHWVMLSYFVWCIHSIHNFIKLFIVRIFHGWHSWSVQFVKKSTSIYDCRRLYFYRICIWRRASCSIPSAFLHLAVFFFAFIHWTNVFKKKNGRNENLSFFFLLSFRLYFICIFATFLQTIAWIHLFYSFMCIVLWLLLRRTSIKCIKRLNCKEEKDEKKIFCEAHDGHE